MQVNSISFTWNT